MSDTAMDQQPDISTLRALNGRPLSMLSEAEEEVLQFFRQRGRKYGVGVFSLPELDQNKFDIPRLGIQQIEEIQKREGARAFFVFYYQDEELEALVGSGYAVSRPIIEIGVEPYREICWHSGPDQHELRLPASLPFDEFKAALTQRLQELSAAPGATRS